MKSSAPLVASIFASFASAAFIACSPATLKPESDCGGKGCKKAATPATSSSTMAEAPLGTVQVPPLAAAPDGGAAAPKPSVPPANIACQDLARCCTQVRDSSERAGCVGITTSQDPSTCANALVAYQTVGGCAHGGGSPNIFNPDMTPNPQQNCAYLQRACQQNPSACDAAYYCGGVSLGSGPGMGGGGGYYDPCTNHPDPYCCRYPNSFDCSGPTDPCASHPDPYCCRYPNTFDCGGSSPAPNPCANHPDPYCCQYPNSFDCGGSALPLDPCANQPDPYCCQYPNSFDCGGGF